MHLIFLGIIPCLLIIGIQLFITSSYNILMSLGSVNDTFVFIPSVGYLPSLSFLHDRFCQGILNIIGSVQVTTFSVLNLSFICFFSVSVISDFIFIIPFVLF